MSLTGPLALLGADRFVPATEPLDRELLDATGKSRPRVVLLAAGGPTDGGFDRLDWSTVVTHHFEALGAEVVRLSSPAAATPTMRRPRRPSARPT
jgi:hypothetical protein